MNEVLFYNIGELKNRLTPALRIRKKELKKQGIYLDEDKIWSYFSKTVWKKSRGLSLAQMLDDILNLEIKLDSI